MKKVIVVAFLVSFTQISAEVIFDTFLEEQEFPAHYLGQECFELDYIWMADDYSLFSEVEATGIEMQCSTPDINGVDILSVSIAVYRNILDDNPFYELEEIDAFNVTFDWIFGSYTVHTLSIDLSGDPIILIPAYYFFTISADMDDASSAFGAILHDLVFQDDSYCCDVPPNWEQHGLDVDFGMKLIGEYTSAIESVSLGNIKATFK